MKVGFTKVAVLVMVIAMVVSIFASCSATPSQSSAPASSAPASSAAAPSASTSAAPATSAAAASASSSAAAAASVAPNGKTIVYSNKSLGYFFFIACQEAVKRGAEGLGYTFESSNADFDSAKQTAQWQNYIAQKPAAIISDPIDSEGLIDSVNKAHDAGIPVGIIDTPTSGGKVDVTVAFDNEVAGQMAAQKIVDLLTVKYGTPKGVVVNVYGAMSSWAWRLRKQGFDEIMQKYPQITYVAVPGEGDIAKTQSALINAYAQYPTIDAVHGPSDQPSRGLAEALKQTNHWFKIGDPKHVIFVTIDGEPIANQQLAAGYYDASVAQDAVSYGEIAVELLNKYTFKGQAVPLGKYSNDQYFWKTCDIVDSPSGPYVKVPPYYLTPDNATDPKHWGNVATQTWGLQYQ